MKSFFLLSDAFCIFSDETCLKNNHEICETYLKNNHEMCETYLKNNHEMCETCLKNNHVMCFLCPNLGWKMKRIIDKHLLEWKDSIYRKPILLRGARQVGKTYAVRQLGKKFKSFVEINFESDLMKVKNLFDLDFQDTLYFSS